MKKLLLISLACMLFAACGMNDKKQEAAATATNKGDDMKALYEQNTAVLKTCFSDFEKNDMDAFAANLTDNVVWHSPMYGDTMTSKAHWIETVKGIHNMIDGAHLAYSLYLPGVDTATSVVDGSSRVYGVWQGTGKENHKPLALNFYGAYKFNKDHKITEAYEYFDAGGLMNAIMAKK